MTKQKIRVKVGDPILDRYSNYDGGGEYIRITNTVNVYVETGIIDLAVRLNNLFMEYGDTYEKLEIEGSHDCGCRYDCHCSPSYYLYGTRLETDLEHNYRLQKEEKQRKDNEERERKEFERLAKKFK